MKAVIIAGCVVLSVLTTASGAQLLSDTCYLLAPPDRDRVEATKRMIWTFRPPPEYDHPFTGSLLLRKLDSAEFETVCPRWTLACTHRVAKIKCFATQCTGTDEEVAASLCIVVMRSDDTLKERGVEPDEVYRHEIGHCNGWPGDHGGNNWVRKLAGED